MRVQRGFSRWSDRMGRSADFWQSSLDMAEQIDRMLQAGALMIPINRGSGLYATEHCVVGISLFDTLPVCLLNYCLVTQFIKKPFITLYMSMPSLLRDGAGAKHELKAEDWSPRL